MRKAPKKFSGGLIGAYEATFGIGWAVGPLFAGIVSEAFGKDVPYLGFFVIGLIVTAILFLNRKTNLQLSYIICISSIFCTLSILNVKITCISSIYNVFYRSTIFINYIFEVY